MFRERGKETHEEGNTFVYVLHFAVSYPLASADFAAGVPSVFARMFSYF